MNAVGDHEAELAQPTELQDCGDEEYYVCKPSSTMMLNEAV